MDVRSLVRRPAVTVSPSATLVAAAKLMDAHSVGVLVVVSRGRVVGVVTDRDLVVRNVSHGGEPVVRVRAVMTKDVATVQAPDEIATAACLMRERGVRRLPVLDGERVIGVISADDLLIWLATMLGAIASPVLVEVLEGSVVSGGR